MELCKKLAIATAGVAILSSLATAPAVAADFNLFGTFADSNLAPAYNNGSFSGTFSVGDSDTYIPSDLK